VSREAVDAALRALNDPRTRVRFARGDLPEGLDEAERALVAAAADDYPDEPVWPAVAGLPGVAAPRVSRGISAAVLDLAARAQAGRPSLEWTTFAVNAAIGTPADPRDLDATGHPAFAAALAYADGADGGAVS